MLERTTIFALWMYVLAPAVVWASIEVHAELDRTPIFLDESVNLILTAKGTSQVSEDPDTSPLRKDFEILGRSIQTSINIVNNVQEIVHRWIIEIKPLRPGITEIPAITIEGKQTEPISLEVKKFSGNVLTAGDDIFMEVEIKPRNPYVQSQATFIVRLYISKSVGVPEGSISNPTLAFSQIEKLGQDRRYQARRAGVDYRVIEKRHAIFPEQSGTMEIPAIVFNGVVSRQDSRTLQTEITRERISTSPLQISVRPKPASFSGATWLPASDLQISDSWDGNFPKLESSKPVTREIRISAVGLRALQLPAPAFEENDSTRIYGNAPVLETSESHEWVLGERKEEYVIIPERDVNIVVPEFRVVWWDVDEDREKVASLPMITAVGTPITVAEDQTPVTEDQSGQPDSIQISASKLDSFWKWMSLGLFALWLLTLLIWYLKRNSYRVQTQGESDERARSARRRKSFLREIRRACSDGNAETACTALLNWARHQWQRNPPRNLMEIGRRMQDELLMKELKTLDQVRYSKQKSTWNGARLWALFRRANVRLVRKPKRKRWFSSWWKSEARLEELWPESGAS